MSAQQIDQTLNIMVALWYLVLSIGAGWGLLRALRQPELRMLGRPHPRRWLLIGVALGSAVFLAGCGLHHVQMAHRLSGPDPMASDGFEFALISVQFVGAPLAGMTLFLLMRHYLVLSIGLRPEREDGTSP